MVGTGEWIFIASEPREGLLPLAASRGSFGFPPLSHQLKKHSHQLANKNSLTSSKKLSHQFEKNTLCWPVCRQCLLQLQLKIQQCIFRLTELQLACFYDTTPGTFKCFHILAILYRHAGNSKHYSLIHNMLSTAIKHAFDGIVKSKSSHPSFSSQ